MREEEERLTRQQIRVYHDQVASLADWLMAHVERASQYTDDIGMTDCGGVDAVVCALLTSGFRLGLCGWRYSDAGKAS